MALAAMSGSAFGALTCELLCASAAHAATDAGRASCHEADTGGKTLAAAAATHSCAEHTELFLAARVAEAQRIAAWPVVPTGSVTPPVDTVVPDAGARTAPPQDRRIDFSSSPSRQLVLRI
jgi:hypothetical protein